MIDPQLPEETSAVTRQTLRQFAALCVLFFGGLAGWHGLVRHHISLAVILAGLGSGMGAVGLSRPESIRPIFTALVTLTLPIGRVVSIVLLAIVFYGVFAPLGLIFRLFGRDALERRRSQRASYWTAKPVVTDLRSYLRQS